MKNFTKFLPLIIACFFGLGSQAQTCPGSLGTTVNIASLPYNGAALTTCGAGNEITASNATICGSSSYYGGEDLVFIFTPTTTGSITISLTSSSSWIGMMLYNGCPFIGQGGTCVGNIQNSGGSKTLTVTVTSGVTYYLVVDTWPSPICIPSFDLSIPAPAGSDPCSSITTLSCGSAVSATPSGAGVWSVTTCGFSTPGQEKIYSFTPATTGPHSLQVNSVSGGYIDYFFKAASGGCNSSGWTCIDDINFTGTYSIGTLTAGVQYYVLLDPEGTGSYNHNFQIVCPAPVVDPCLSITTLACATPATVTLSGTGVWNNSTCFFSTPGQEKMYSFTPTVTGVHNLQVTSATGTGYIDYQYKAASAGCSATGWTCIDDLNFTGTITIGNLTAGVQYYLLLDAESTTSSTQTFQIICPAPVSDPCLSITTLACATPATATLSGTGAWNNSTCVFSTPGQEKLYSFTPTVTGAHQLQVTSATGTGYIDYQYKAASGGCSASGWTCIDDINFTGIFTIGNLTAGVQYYLLLDAESTTSSTQTFQIICPAATPPCIASPTSPTNGASFCLPEPGTLSWSSAAGATSYEVYFGTSPTPPLYTTTSATSVSVGSLTSGTYYWQIRPANGGGTASGCPVWSFSVDITPPTIQCIVGTLNPAANANCQYVVQDLTGFAIANDNCGTLTLSQTPTVGTTLGLGSTTLTLTATDGSGNMATCTINLSVTDQTAPTITNCPNNQNVLRNASCEAVLPNYTGFPTTGDNCPGAITVTQMPTPGTIINSTVTVTLTATDAAGNMATCSFTATPVDQTPPTITNCPNNQNVLRNASCEAVLPNYTGFPTTGDNCPGAITVTQMPVPGTIITSPVTVTLTATDLAGNMATCSFTATPVDQTPPTITCPATQTLLLGANCGATLPNYTSLATIGDNCGIQSVTQSPAAGTPVSGAGNMTVTLTVTDINGNPAQCSFTVSKVDQTPPTLVCKNTTVLIGNGGNYTLQPADVFDATASSDNCSGVLTVMNISPATVSCAQLNQTISVTVTVQDGSGNMATCTAQITVQEGTTLPEGWSSANVGNANGDAGYKTCTFNGGFTVTANGFSTSSADVLHFASRQLCGNGEIIARVETVSGSGWAGVMLRESLAPGSKKVTLKTQLTSIIRREIRSVTNGATSMLNFNRPQHGWLRLVRSGSNFIGYTSIDGTNWSFAFSTTVSMTGCIYAGVFAESINANTTTTASFSNVNIIGAQNNLVVNPSDGIEDLNGIMPALDVSVFPNPTSGEVNVNFANAPTGILSIQVFNTLGESILLKETEGAGIVNERLDLSDLADGVYFITVQAAGYTPLTKRVVLAKAWSLRP